MTLAMRTGQRAVNTGVISAFRACENANGDQKMMEG